jgi:hypothetical protein
MVKNDETSIAKSTDFNIQAGDIVFSGIPFVIGTILAMRDKC